MKKKDLNQLKEIARTLPSTKYDVPHKMQVEKDGEVYLTQVAGTMHEVNHERRIVDAYYRGGIPLVREYCRDVIELSKACRTPLKLKSNALYIPYGL